MSDATIIKTVFFNASRETVWAFLTEKNKLGQWFHAAEADLAEGRDYTLIETKEDGEAEKICWGTVELMQPPSELVYTFTIKPLSGVITTVRWTLEEVHGGTKLTMRHEGIGTAGASALSLLTALDAGWDGHIGKLRTSVSEQ